MSEVRQQVPLGTAQPEFCFSQTSDRERFRIDCKISGAFVDLGLTEGQEGTFVDPAAGIDPIGRAAGS